MFEFKCLNCAHLFEEIMHLAVKTGEVAKIPCPRCNTADARRLVSGSSFYLNGRGWANEGYEKKWAPDENKLE